MKELPYSDTNAGLHYDLHLDLHPQTSFIAVTGSISYHSPLPRLERARFYLHRQFNIQRLQGSRVYGYQFQIPPTPESNRFPQAGILDVYFNPPLGSHDGALIQFEYSGNITGWDQSANDQIDTDWVELGMDLPWYPLQFTGGPSNLTFTLKVTCPAGYQVGSFGRAAFRDGTWFFNWPYVTSDIVVAAGTSLESREYNSSPNHVILNSATFREPAANRLGEDVLWSLERFAGWFGPTRPSDFTVIQSPRGKGEKSARRGLVMLNGLAEHDYLNQREAYLPFLYHETARAWWWEAPRDSWENWLNESFAEYSALLAVRERLGASVFERLIDQKRQQITGLPPLWYIQQAVVSTPEKQDLASGSINDQGTLLLHGLAERIGYTRFLDFCRAMLWSGVTTTRHLLDLLAEIEDMETSRWLEDQLKNGQ